MDQNVLGQSSCRIFWSNISLEQNNEITWFFAYWYKSMEIKSWLKIEKYWGGCGHFGHRAIKLATSQGNKRIN